MRRLTTPDGKSVMMYDSNDPTSTIPPTLINAYSVLTIPAYWRAVNFLANNLSSFPRSVQKDGAAQAVPHPLDRLLERRPNPYQNATAFWRTLFFAAVHHANGYARIERGRDLSPAALHNLTPEDVTPFRIVHDTGPIQQWYHLSSTKTALPGADVIHLTGLGCDGMTGMDPVRLHAGTFQRAATLDKYQTRFLMKGTVLKGAIEIPGDVSDEKLKEVKAYLRANFRGSDAEDDVLLLTDGAKLNNATLTPQESQLIEQSAFTTKQIAQITGVPPQFLYDLSEGKYNSVVEQAGIDVVRYAFRPWIEQTEDELTLKLLTTAEQDAGYGIHLNPDALLRGDTAAVNASAVTTTNAGLRTRNEGRALLGLPPDADPESNKLKTLGDTNPKPADPKTAA